jgi:hypothetical protein
MEIVTRGKEIHAHPRYPERLRLERKGKERKPMQSQGRTNKESRNRLASSNG